MISPYTTLPADLVNASRQADTVNYITAQPWPGHFKRLVLVGWAVTVGVKVPQETYNAVEKSGSY